MGQHMPISPNRMASHHLSPLSGGQELRHCSELVVFSLSYQFWSKEGIGAYAYCISVKVMTLIGIKGGKVHGTEYEKTPCEQSHSAWERYESLSRCQPFHPTEDQRWMLFHSQVRAGIVCTRARWFSCDEACDLWGEISEIKKVKNMDSIFKGVSGDCHWLMLVLEVMYRGLS